MLPRSSTKGKVSGVTNRKVSSKARTGTTNELGSGAGLAAHDRH